ncbi:MAG: cardiolipin synthase [Planctomycetes bacterium]|nr:cardiolipin synthase [Planctomycetota bacterium]
MVADLLLLLHPAFTAVWLTLAVLAGGHAVMYKRDPKSAAIWLFVSFSIPLVGAWLYWVFGINRVERRAVRRLGGREKPFHRPEQLPIGEAAERDAAAVGHLTALRDITDRVTRLPLLPANRLTPLHNGEQAYPAMLEAIAAAQRSVTLASYIFDWDEVGHQFADCLGAAAARGVRVQVLLDGVGAVGIASRMGRRLLKSGAEVAAFFPLRFPWGRLRLNLRSHRKLLIADGRVGFTGGMNISARHLVDRPSPRRVEDLHFRLVGPVVAELQQAFAEDWFMATGELLSGEDYFPPLSAEGGALCRAIISGPDEDFEKIHWILLGALAAAQRSVRIATPYFIPPRELISAMVMAALRGVAVTLILPSQVDHRFMRWAADAYLWELLEHGVRVVRRPPPFVHTKLMIVDERLILLGSANLDRRSLRLNFEFNVEAYDVELAPRLAGWLDGQAAAATPVTLADVDSRPPWRRLRDGLVKLLSPHL